MVIGLDLCPFAAGPARAGRVRLALSVGRTEHEVMADVADELVRLVETPPDSLSTTLICAPHLGDFDTLRDVLGSIDALLDQADLRDEFQAVGFHPDAVYDGADPDDPANATARAPIPVIHLLREAEVADAIARHPDPEGIPARNTALLRSMADARDGS